MVALTGISEHFNGSGLACCSSGAGNVLRYVDSRGAGGEPVAVMSVRPRGTAEDRSSAVILTQKEMRAVIDTYGKGNRRGLAVSQYVSESELENFAQLLLALSRTWGGWDTIWDDIDADKIAAHASASALPPEPLA